MLRSSRKRLKLRCKIGHVVFVTFPALIFHMLCTYIPGTKQLLPGELQDERHTKGNNACGTASRTYPNNTKLKVEVDFLSASDIRVVSHRKHGDFGKPLRFGVAQEKLRHGYCATLNPFIWIDCIAMRKLNSLEKKLAKKTSKIYAYCTSDSYIIEVSCAFVELWGATHKDVPGAVFDQRRTFTPQIYSRAARTDYPATVKFQYDDVGVALYPYPTAKGHFVHETLSRVIWLLTALPESVPIVAPMSSWTKKYYDIISQNGFNISRIVPFENIPNSIMFAKRVYFAAEWPYCEQPGNPNAGGEPTEYPYEIMEPLRRSLVPVDKPRRERRTILVIDRGYRYRRLLEHRELVLSLRRDFGKSYDIKEFGPNVFNRPLSEHIQLFSSAAVVVGPHGAGFANLVFCAEGTGVIEIGYDSSDVMSLDEMYFQLSMGLHLRYWLILGKGSYNTNISVNVNYVNEVVSAALKSTTPN